MATIKSYTDIEQSKKLAEFLPLESADMHYTGHQNIINPKEWEYKVMPNSRVKYISFDDKRVFYPCWSLASLLGVLPDYTLQTTSDGTVFVVCDSKKPMISNAYNNPIDACYEMIIRLHELNLL